MSEPLPDDAGAYTVESRLEGSPGELEPPLFLARSPAGGERVFLHLLAKPQTECERAPRYERLRRLGSLAHPRLPSLLELNEEVHGGLAAWAWEPGESLRARLRRGPMELEAAVSIAAGIARGLAILHQAGFAHGSLRPAIVYCTARESVQLLLAGAHLSRPASRDPTDETGLWSAAYLSPEQHRGTVAEDLSSDLWSLGVILFEMLTGELPFLASTCSGMATAIRTQEPLPVASTPGHLPFDLEGILDGALARSPGDRYADTGAVLADLTALAARLHSRPSPPPASKRPSGRPPPTQLEGLGEWISSRRRQLSEAPGPGLGELILLPTLALAALIGLAIWLWCQRPLG